VGDVQLRGVAEVRLQDPKCSVCHSKVEGASSYTMAMKYLSLLKTGKAKCSHWRGQ
jgi:hypothetical protein